MNTKIRFITIALLLSVATLAVAAPENKNEKKARKEAPKPARVLTSASVQKETPATAAARGPA